MKKHILILIIVHLTFFLQSQSEAEKLVNQSIEFHDPKGQWSKLLSDIEITSIVERKGVIDTSFRSIHLNLAEGKFSMRQDTVLYEFPCSNCERATMYNSYFRYLLGMPMKLKDPGTIIQEKIDIKKYKGKSYRVVTVNYEPSVGTYTWLFYFEMDSPELRLTEFSKDGTFQNGETIELNNKVRFQKMLLPGQLKWFVLPDRPFLAEENIKYSKIRNK